MKTTSTVQKSHYNTAVNKSKFTENITFFNLQQLKGGFKIPNPIRLVVPAYTYSAFMHLNTSPFLPSYLVGF